MNLLKDLVRLACVLIFVVACHMARTAGTQLTAFDTQGHRGCRGLMPENTIPAMVTALNLGVTTLEMDVVITKDKQVVLSHEPFMNHEIVTRPDGSLIEEREQMKYNIYQMNYEEVKKYDVGLKPHPRFPRQEKMKAIKPLLSDLIDSVDQYMITSRRPHPYYNIETKCLPIGDNLYHPAPAEFVNLLMGVIKNKQIEERVIIQSFDFRTLKYLHEHYPNIKTAMLIEDDDKRSFEQQLQALGFVPTIYSPHYSLVNPALIEKCRERNIRVIPWTVNDKPTIERLKELGVDGIISDYPDLF
ncbi:MAG TPA: glycerophosphodiester phosphodiesterase [Chitinophagaceae bacterium]|nr:glycerophosphodiester phosphodiesterase [Chitinophagaceae bacterium]